MFLCPDDKENDPDKPMKNLSPIKPADTPPSVVTSLPNDAFPAPQIKQSTSPTASPDKYNMLLHTHDTVPHDLEEDLVPLSPSLTDEEYMFSLSNEEGIADLFDAYDITIGSKIDFI